MKIGKSYISGCWAILLLVIFFGCDKPVTQTDSLRSVLITSPMPIGNSSSETYSGVIEEGKSVNASFMADGKINSMAVKEGDRVKKGQLIATLDDSDYKIGVNQLKVQFKQMTEEKKRMDEMFARHNIAPNDYEKFTAGYEQLRLQIEMAENKLGYTKLYSPTDGYVAEKFMESGELTGAGTPVYKITDDSRLIANVDLPVNAFLNKEKILSAYGYSPAYPDVAIPLTIESFTPDASNNMLYKMKLLVDPKYRANLSPGMNMKVEITSSDGDGAGYLIPVRAIGDEAGKKFVWVYNPGDSAIYKKYVNVVGVPSEKNITVGGLDGNERIVETGLKQLHEGEKVHISKNSDFGL